MIKDLFFEKDWNRDGGVFHHRQVFNSGNVYVYEVNPIGSDRPWYEVFKRRLVADVTVIDGKLVKSESDMHVKYPNDEAFGKWAFCLHDKESVERLLKDRNERLKDTSFNDLYQWLSEAQN